MKKKISVFFLILLTTSLFCNACSCSSANLKYTATASDILPRTSFVHIKKRLSISRCFEDRCAIMNFDSAASGFIMKVVSDGSFIITAAHVCTDAAPIKFQTDKIHSRYRVYRLDGEKYTAKVLTYDVDIDVCLIFAKDLTNDVRAVRIAREKPKPGDRIYNIAAPRGLFQPNAAPILEGRYNGRYGNSDWYTLPAAPGSSGSMIVNHKGELVGMVHSVFINFMVMTLSTEYEDLKLFINSNLHKYMTYKKVMDLLELKDIFRS